MTSSTPAASRRSASSRILLYVFNDAAFFMSHRGAVARAAQDCGFAVHVATAPGPGAAEIAAAGFSHHEIPLTRSGVGARGELATFRALKSLYRSLRPALIEHATIKPVLYGSFAARLVHSRAVVNWVTGLGHVFDPHYSFARVRRAVATNAYRAVLALARSEVIVENEALLEFMRDRVGVPSARLALIRGAGVDMSAFTPAVRSDHARPLTFMLASRMLWTKGVGEFVAAARAVQSHGHFGRFVLVGAPDPGNPAGITEDELRGWVNEGVVEWWGHRSDMPRVFEQADVVVLPSYGEGLPKVLAEAAAAGKPLIATAIAGCLEVVLPGQNGISVPVRDAAALARAMEHFLRMPASDLAALGARSRALAVERFALTRVITETIAVYERALARSK